MGNQKSGSAKGLGPTYGGVRPWETRQAPAGPAGGVRPWETAPGCARGKPAAPGAGGYGGARPWETPRPQVSHGRRVAKSQSSKRPFFEVFAKKAFRERCPDAARAARRTAPRRVDPVPAKKSGGRIGGSAAAGSADGARAACATPRVPRRGDGPRGRSRAHARRRRRCASCASTGPTAGARRGAVAATGRAWARREETSAAIRTA